MSQILLSSLFWGMSIISFFAVVHREVIFSRVMLAQAMIFVVFLALFFRFFLRSLQKYFWSYGYGVSYIFLLGEKKSCKKFTSLLSSYPEFSVSGFARSHKECPLEKVDELWHVDQDFSKEKEQKLRNLCHKHHIIFRFLPVSTQAFARMDMSIFGGIPLLCPIPAAVSGWGQVIKRGIDICLSFLAILLLLPLFLLLALGIKTSAGPIFYSAQRVGKQGKVFTIWKFRSMLNNADDLKKNLQEKNHRKDGPFFKMKNDPRITTFGKFLRRWSLDELPQLWNVLKGDMSLVGPRPHFSEEIQKFPIETRRILSLKPGITGITQVSGRSDLSFEEELRLDMYFLENWSLWIDAKIILKTLEVIIRGKGAD